MVFNIMAHSKNRLKLLFVASAMLTCFTSKAQQILTNTAKAPDLPKTAILFIRGPENKNDQEKQKLAFEELIEFKTIFKGYDVITLGDGKQSVSLSNIQDSLVKIASFKPERIVLLNYMHGKQHIIEQKNPSNPAFGTFKTDTRLQITEDGGEISGDSLYKNLGDFYSQNEILKGIPFDLATEHCDNEGTLNGYHHFPARTRIFYYADASHPKWAHRGHNGFTVAFQKLLVDKKQPILDERGVLVTAIYAANYGLAERMNDLHVLLINDQPADTLIKDHKKYSFGIHGSTLIHPSDIISELLKNRNKKEVAQAIMPYESYLSLQEQKEAIRWKKEENLISLNEEIKFTPKNVFPVQMALLYSQMGQTIEDDFKENTVFIPTMHKDNVKNMTGETWDHLCLMAVLLAMQENKYGVRAIDHAMQEKQIGRYKPDKAQP